jgi:hypothetical protein
MEERERKGRAANQIAVGSGSDFGSAPPSLSKDLCGMSGFLQKGLVLTLKNEFFVSLLLKNKGCSDVFKHLL